MSIGDMKGQHNLANMKALLGAHTKQLGRLFCIPASVSNALRVLGSTAMSQDWIRDIYYKTKGRTPEPQIDQQMAGASFDAIDAIKATQDFSEQFVDERYSDSRDDSFFDYSKADKAMQWIEGEVSQDRPVVVSTWFLPLFHGSLHPVCCHMFLILAYDPQNSVFWYHDCGDDAIRAIARSAATQIVLNGTAVQLEHGLRGRITHTDYCCCSFRRR